MTLTQEQLAEFVKCKTDPVYFIDTYSFVENPTRGIIPFKLYEFQKEILHKYQADQFNILNKSRQTGISTLTANYALWHVLFNIDKNVIIISMTDNDAMDFLRKVKTAYYNLPAWLQGTPVTDNAHELELSTGSRIKSVPSSLRAGRGKTPSLLIIDEVAHIERVGEIWTSSYPSLSRGGKGILISTPNGVGNFFHLTWERAKTKENEFTWTFVHWTQVPEYDENWYTSMRKQVIDPREWAQEYEGDFLASGDTVVEGWKLKEIKEKKSDTKTQEWLDKPIETSLNDKLWIFKKPVPNYTYVCAVDTASGVAADYSAIQILCIDTQEQVAEYMGKCQINELSDLAFKLCTEYNEALMIVENNGIGLATVNRIYNHLGYANFYIMENLATGIPTKIPGFNITKARPLVIGAIQRYFLEGLWTFHSERLFNELTTFVWKNGKAQAQSGYHDDLTISLGTAFLLSEYAMKMKPISIWNDDSVDKNFVNELGMPENTQKEKIIEEPVETELYQGNHLDNMEDLTWLYSK